MLKKYSTISAALMAHASVLETDLYGYVLEDPELSCDDEAIDSINGLLALAKRMADQLLLDSVVPLMERIAARLQNSYSVGDAYKDVSDLRSRVQDQLKTREFYFVAPAYLGYYKDKQLFGSEVEERFPKAISDIEDAGKCLALGLGTSCVMHLMRVMEAGLKEFALVLGIPYAPSWESYLKQIQDRIDTKHRQKGIQWRRHEKFFRDASGDLISVKQAWRNPSMHVERRYTPEEAEEIFRAVRTFMRKLAQDLPRKAVPLKKPSSP